MRRFNSDLADLFISKEEAKDYGIRNQSDAEEFIDEKIDQFFYGKDSFREYCELYARLTGLKPYAILAAHGNTNGEWVYSDSGKTRSVQRWINLRDGKYGTLIIYACNPGVHTPSSKKSLLWAPDADVRLSESFRGDYTFDLITPTKGIIDSYVIDYELGQLKCSEPAPK